MAYGRTFPSSGKHQQLQSLVPLTIVVLTANDPKTAMRIITGSALRRYIQSSFTGSSSIGKKSALQDEGGQVSKFIV